MSSSEEEEAYSLASDSEEEAAVESDESDFEAEEDDLAAERTPAESVRAESVADSETTQSSTQENALDKRSRKIIDVPAAKKRASKILRGAPVPLDSLQDSSPPPPVGAFVEAPDSAEVPSAIDAPDFSVAETQDARSEPKPPSSGKKREAAKSLAPPKPPAPKPKAAPAAAARPKGPKGRVLEYMDRTNRPYSAQNVFDNLGRQPGKGAVQAILEELCEGSAAPLSTKTFGKSRLFWKNQRLFDAAELSAPSVARLQGDASRAEEAALLARRKASEAMAKLSALQAQPTDAALDARLDELHKTCAEQEQRLQALGSGPKVSRKDRERTVKRANEYRKQWVKRRRQAMDVVEMIADGWEKKVKHVVDAIGVETDEEYNVTVPEALKA